MIYVKVDLYGVKELHKVGCHVVTLVEETNGQHDDLKHEEKNKKRKK